MELGVERAAAAAAAAANATGLCAPGTGSGSGSPGAWVRSAYWMRARGRDCHRVEGTGPRGQERGWALASAVLPGRRADREEAPPCGQSHRYRRHRRCPGTGPRLPLGLGGPAVLTAPVSLKMVTSFLLACL